MTNAEASKGVMKASLFAHAALKSFVERRKVMINGTCVHCDAEQDLVPICIPCANGKVTMVVEKGCKAPSTAVSKEIDTPAPDLVKSVLNRLKSECGFGVPDGHE